jgi:23S rRNA pseudouridine1911/1915/1917 synthase
MVKVSSSDIIAILRRFEVATDEQMPRHIEQMTFSNPSPTNTMVSFRFNRQQFYVLFDDTAEDDTNYVLEQVRTHKVETVGDVLENPTHHLTTYALPFKGKEVYVFMVRSLKKRLDVALAERYPETSRSTWQKHIKAGHVSVNGVVRESPKTDVTEGDSLEVAIPDATDFSEHELPIVYIDDNVIVINKPVGILTHSKGALNDEFTVAGFFGRYSTYGIDTNRPGIVHRLDRDTSGIMIGARNPETAAMLQKQFAERKTKKTYMAVVNGTLKEQEAKIDLPIGRNPNAPSTFRIDSKGKSAVTRYRVLATSGKLSLVELRPETGRTHQLRVHMQYLGAPIHGDRVYGKSADRLYLHAAALEITIPGGQRKTFEAPVPPAFTDLFNDTL